MPGLNQQKDAITTQICRRCQQTNAAINVRTEPLCKDCFSRYVHTKVVKRMETFRVRHAEVGNLRTLLLPLSLGVCSLSLLHILSLHLQNQLEKSGRPGYKLHVLHILTPEEEETSSNSAEEALQRIKAQYPEALYSSIPLSSILEQQQDATAEDSFLPQLTPSEEEQTTNSSSQRLQLLLSKIPTATSRSDLTHLLQRKLTLSFATTHSCSAILWSHSTTRLAELTIAETAKGRGFSLPWLISDGEAPTDSKIPSYYPLRDVLRKEILSFAEFLEPTPLTDLAVVREETKMISAKKATIDALMGQYFESVERDYPSIVANVVRTTSKLQARGIGEQEARCELCEMPLDGQAPERSRLCYGCIQTLPRVES